MKLELRPLLALLSATLALGSCIFLPKDADVTFASDPPGARVLIDGKDTGFVTPCGLALERNDDTRLDIALPGYVTATRFLTPDHQVYVLLWREMTVSKRTFRFPLWLNVRDFFARSLGRRCSSSFTSLDFLSTAGGDNVSASLGRELLPDADRRCRGASLFAFPGPSRFCVSPPPLPLGGCV